MILYFYFKFFFKFFRDSKDFFNKLLFISKINKKKFINLN